MVGVSGRLVSHAKRVIDAGSPELINAVECGQVAVTRASQLARLPHAEQSAALRGGKKSIKKATKKRPARKSVSQEFYNVLQKAEEEIADKENRYGGFDGMVQHKKWNTSDTSAVLEAIERLKSRVDRLYEESRQQATSVSETASG